ncbi:hypothetical protein J3A83DRAFT_2002714 [Scleroderma citrinum]
MHTCLLPLVEWSQEYTHRSRNHAMNSCLLYTNYNDFCRLIDAESVKVCQLLTLDHVQHQPNQIWNICSQTQNVSGSPATITPDYIQVGPHLRRNSCLHREAPRKTEISHLSLMSRYLQLGPRINARNNGLTATVAENDLVVGYLPAVQKDKGPLLIHLRNSQPSTPGPAETALTAISLASNGMMQFEVINATFLRPLTIFDTVVNGIANTSAPTI